MCIRDRGCDGVFEVFDGRNYSVVKPYMRVVALVVDGVVAVVSDGW